MIPKSRSIQADKKTASSDLEDGSNTRSKNLDSDEFDESDSNEESGEDDVEEESDDDEDDLDDVDDEDDDDDEEDEEEDFGSSSVSELDEGLERDENDEEDDDDDEDEDEEEEEEDDDIDMNIDRSKNFKKTKVDSDNESLTPIEDDSFEAKPKISSNETPISDHDMKSISSSSGSVEDKDYDSEKEFLEAVNRDDVDEDKVFAALHGGKKRKNVDFESMTARQRSKALSLQQLGSANKSLAEAAEDDLVELPLYEPSLKRKKLSKEEADLRRNEKIKQRRHQKERKLQEEKQATLAKLLNKSDSGAANGAVDSEDTKSNTVNESHCLRYSYSCENRASILKAQVMLHSNLTKKPVIAQIQQDVTSPTVMHMDFSETLPDIKDHQPSAKPVPIESVETYHVKTQLSFPSAIVSKLSDPLWIKQYGIDSDEARESLGYMKAFFKL